MHNYSASPMAANPDFLSIAQLSREDLFSLLAISRDFRAKTVFGRALEGKSVAMIFQKPSLRTRVTFEVAIRQLGGWPILLGPVESQLGQRDACHDAARNLSLCVESLLVLSFSHTHRAHLALFAPVPMIFRL